MFLHQSKLSGVRVPIQHSLLITCPLPSAIGTLTGADCPEHFGQILRVAFGRSGATFTDETDFATELTWDTNLAAADDTKVQFSPTFENLVLPQGEAVTEGGDDNTTQFGQIIVLGKTTITVTSRYRGLPAANKLELESYLSEGAIFGNLGVYLVDEFGRLIGNQPGGTGTAVSPIPISSYFIGDPGSEGFNTHTFTPQQWNFIGGWADTIITVTPDFDPLTKPNP